MITYDDLHSPQRGDVYRHYKGDYYTITGLVLNTETDAIDVLYAREFSSSEEIGFSQPIGKFLGFTDTHEKRFTHQAHAQPAQKFSYDAPPSMLPDTKPIEIGPIDDIPF
jgi:hypothetical protein